MHYLEGLAGAIVIIGLLIALGRSWN